MRALLRALPFGMADAGLASLATFAVGLAAAAKLTPADLGTYAVYFSAFLLGAVIPTQLVLVPAEVQIVSHSSKDRLDAYSRSLRLGAIAALPGLLAIVLAHFIVHARTEVAVAFGLTSAVSVFLSPLQDHIRRMFHLAGMSQLAAATSLVQATVSIAAVVILPLVAPVIWVPFGALALANAVSLTTASLMAGAHAEGFEGPMLRLPGLARRGGWLVFAATLASAAGFAASALIRGLAGSEALGYSEAARVVSQPILVLVAGLSAITGPHSVEAAATGSLSNARKVSRSFALVVGVAGSIGLLLAGGAWRWNPMFHLVPKAYTVSGLVAFTILANVSMGIVWPYRSELLGARRESRMARTDAASAVSLLVASGTAHLTGAFAKPMGTLAVGLTRWVGYGAQVPDIYRHTGDLISALPHEVPKATPPLATASKPDRSLRTGL